MIKILVIDDHPIIYQGLVQMLQEDTRFQVVGNAKNYEEAFEMIAQFMPDLIIVDIGLRSEKNGIDIVRMVSEEYPEIKSMVLSMHDEEVYSIRAYNAGARGFVNKSEFTEKISEAIEEIIGGGLYFTLGSSFIEHKGGRLKQQFSRLTDREIEILKCIGEGMKSDDIAVKCGLKEKTVHSHRLRIRNKLQLETTADLIRLAASVVEDNLV
ncbi:MAG: response regulator transcription factor [Spirochaetes bacterium]|jgi:DNA-binding NarL/FixJ family response regulator|nr:response regulator transcription factor [Spirochaetota bacterium]